MLLVGPEAKVSTGYFSTNSALISVPSFWLMKKGAVNAQIAQRTAEGLDDALGQVCQAGVHDRRILAFEQPDAADFVRQADAHAWDLLGQDFGRNCCSWSGLTGEKTAETATQSMPAVANLARCCRGSLSRRAGRSAGHRTRSRHAPGSRCRRSLRPAPWASRQRGVARRSPAGRCARPRCGSASGARRRRW